MSGVLCGRKKEGNEVRGNQSIVWDVSATSERLDHSTSSGKAEMEINRMQRVE